MLITSQGAGVLWVLGAGVTYSNLSTALHFLEKTLLTYVPSASKQHRDGAHPQHFLPCPRGCPGSVLSARKEVSPCGSSQFYQITSGCLVS